MTVPDPPSGWIDLQERAKCAKNAEELAAIIDEMNKLLSEYEKAAGDGHKEGLMPAADPKSGTKKGP